MTARPNRTANGDTFAVSLFVFGARRLLIAACLALFGCGGAADSPNKLLAEAARLRAAGKSDEALRKAGEAAMAAGAGSARFWEIRFFQVQILQGSQSPEQEIELLRPEPPSGPAFAEIRARRALYLAYAEWSRMRLDEADGWIERAFADAAAANLGALRARIEFMRVRSLVSRERFDEAEEVLRGAMAQADSSGDRAAAALGIQVSVGLLESRFQFEDALKLLERSLSLADASKDKAAREWALLDIGLCRYRLGQSDQALEALREAESIAKSLPDPVNLAAIEGNLGNIYLDRQDRALARECYERALTNSRVRGNPADMAKWLSNLSLLATENREWDRAEQWNERARLGTRPNPYYLRNRGRILEGRGRISEAAAAFLEAANAPGDDLAPKLDARADLARMLANQGDDAKAVQAFESAIGSVGQAASKLKEDQVKISYLSSLNNVFGDYVEFLMARGRTERALEIAEASRAQILQAKLGDAGAPAMSASAYRRLAKESGAILLSFWLGQRTSYGWLTSSAGIVSYPLPARDELSALVEQYRALVENLHDPLDSDDSSGRELYRALLAPVLPRIPVGSNLVIVPDGGLNALNFETIPIPGSKPHYFLEDVTMSVAPSLNLLGRAGGRPPRPNNPAVKLLLIGNPVAPNNDFAKLPYAAEEIRAVENHFDRKGAVVLSGEAASPAAYRELAGAGFDFVHFTAHASSNRNQPFESAIILSGPRGANRLRAGEVSSSVYPAGLVTISACRGAGAKTYAGEGLVGFMWAFFKAGARNIIAGLWDVSDESTPKLMDLMYGNLAKGQTIPGSLRAAKLALLRNEDVFRLPYYWAPFQLYARQIAPVSPDKVMDKIARHAKDRNGEMAGKVLAAPHVRSLGAGVGRDQGRLSPLPGSADDLR